LKKLLINASGQVAAFLKRYEIWVDHTNMYKNNNKQSLVEINDCGIPCFHFTEIDRINQTKNSIVAIDCLTEGIHSINYFKQYCKNNYYIIFSNDNWNPDFYNLEIKYSLVTHHFFLFEMADIYLSPQRFCFYLEKMYKFEYPKSCIFSSTVGNVRSERNKFIRMLQNTISYDNYILKYSGQDLASKSDTYDIVHFDKGMFDPYTWILDKYYHSVSQTLPIEIYNQSYFNLVVETDIITKDNFLLTEKTIKSLISGMPFVIMSTPYFLKNLKALGFETFDSLWDESYDTIIDFDQRIVAVSNLCDQLGKFDWELYKPQLQNIARVNQLNFLNLNRLANKEFIEFENTILELL
jgi:hypothetical protein